MISSWLSCCPVLLLKHNPAKITAPPLGLNEYKIRNAVWQFQRKLHRGLISSSVCASLIPREVFILVEADDIVRAKIISHVFIGNSKKTERASH